MKVLLINPNFRGSKNTHDVNIRSRQPLDLAYLSAILEKKGIDNEILDANVLNLSENETLKKIDLFSPSHVILTTSPLDRWECPQVDIRMVFSLLKKIGLSIKLIVYGTHGSVSPEWVRKKAGRKIDWLIKGEPEKPVAEIFDSKSVCLSNNVYQNLDELPLPNFKKLKMDLYAYNGKELPGPFSVLLSSRGCPYQCTFCLREMFKGYRTHSPARVVEEIKHLKDNYSINSIFFQDWEFLLDKERAEKICELMKSNNLRINFGINARVQDLDFELIKKLQEVGLKRINVGMESASTKILEKAQKGITKEDLARTAKLVKRTGVKIGYCGMYNLPGEDFSTIKETAKFVVENDIDFIAGVVRPYPGTKIAEDAFVAWENVDALAGRIGTKIHPSVAILLFKLSTHYYRDGLFFALKPRNFKKAPSFFKRFFKKVRI